jgi:hypothetical protein
VFASLVSNHDLPLHPGFAEFVVLVSSHRRLTIAGFEVRRTRYWLISSREAASTNRWVHLDPYRAVHATSRTAFPCQTTLKLLVYHPLTRRVLANPRLHLSPNVGAKARSRALNADGRSLPVYFVRFAYHALSLKTRCDKKVPCKSCIVR